MITDYPANPGNRSWPAQTGSLHCYGKFHLLGEFAPSLDSTLIGPANFAKKARNSRLEPAP